MISLGLMLVNTSPRRSSNYKRFCSQNFVDVVNHVLIFLKTTYNTCSVLKN